MKSKGRQSRANVVTLQCQEGPTFFPVPRHVIHQCRHQHQSGGGSSRMAKAFMIPGPGLLLYRFPTTLTMQLLPHGSKWLLKLQPSGQHSTSVKQERRLNKGTASLPKDTPWKLLMILPCISHCLELSHMTISRNKEGWEMSLYSR